MSELELEQPASIKFLVKLVKSGNEIREILVQVCGDKPPPPPLNFFFSPRKRKIIKEDILIILIKKDEKKKTPRE